MGFSRMIRRNVLALFLLLIVVLSSFGNRSHADSLESEFGYLENFSDVYNLIKSKYVTKFESKQLIYSAIAGMVNELDPYSSILSRKELEKLELQSVGQYVGIGVMVQKSGDQIIVTQVFENSPAQKAGIKPGDIIISIEGNLLAEKKNEEISSLLSGAEGTLVGLGFAHPEEPDNLLKVKLKRELIKANSAECRVHESEITLVSIHQFLKHTAREIVDCKTRHNNQSLIVDLRNNPGGLLISAVEAADLFVGLGDIVQVRDRENRIIERYIARAPVSEKPPLLIILINRYS
ncbi:MAG: S41 family peptidase, partial [Chlorobiales bacterium]|nr:S41 family peptidase [Chlorobiales bacterium]